ncbi:hypothetical protein [Celeribacter halophilus]|uniref:hypothetical protein n=1 Tax=Celeribacter halophilus TaxID=576117 RepID=UPI003A906310
MTESDREKARLDARVSRLRAETRAKHRGYIKSVGKMLLDLQFFDRNPFEICGVPNKLKDRWKKNEEKRKRVCWDDRIYTFLGSAQRHCDQPHILKEKRGAVWPPEVR